MDNLTPEQLAALAKQDQGPLTKSIIIAFTILALVAVVLRIFTRLRYVGARLGWEDYTIILSMIVTIISSVFQILQTNAGNGKHIMFVDPKHTGKMLYYLFLSIVFYNVSLTSTKMSILLQYRRIFNVQKMRIPLYLSMAFCTSFGIVAIVIGVYTCPPGPPDQKAPVAQKNCLDTYPTWYAAASINIFSDLLVAFLPVRVVWKLQIARRPKIALIGILTIGWFVCVVSILRLHSLTVLAEHPSDSTYYSAAAAYWSSIEMNLGIVCASLPALKPLVVKVIPGFSSRGGSDGYGLGTDGHTNVKNTSHGVRSTARRADTDDIELGVSGSTVYPSESSNDSIVGKNIYVSRHFEQHYDDNSPNSDSESQKDLVERH